MNPKSHNAGPAPREAYLVVAGPTGVGKSALALEVAERVGGEIVVADSRQVYRGIDVGTAKPSTAERGRVPHHLLDIVELGNPYSAANFTRDARMAIAAIQARGRTAVVCGGTGFYLAALAGGLDSLEEGLPDERQEARARVAVIPPARRHAALGDIDPASARRLHPHDRQRVDRALEVFLRTGESLSARHAGGGKRLPHRAVWLTRPRNELRSRIEERLDAMLAAGLEAEARNLWEAGWSPRDPGLDTIGYQEWWPFFEGSRTHEETRRAILAATCHYAKRQETWFRHQGDYRPVSATEGAAGVLAVWEARR